jgi:hypothetical protein
MYLQRSLVLDISDYTKRRSVKMKRLDCISFGALILFVMVFVVPALGSPQEAVREMKLINPEGVVNIEPMKANPHPGSLEGKTVVLQWNGKQNGDNFMNQIAALLSENVKGIKIIKAWEEAPELKIISQNPEKSRQLAQRIAAFKPDLVIAGEAD